MVPADLLAGIGGSMGLFVGISVLSIIEVVGDLGVMRLIPRIFGYRSLYGLGTRHANSRAGGDISISSHGHVIDI